MQAPMAQTPKINNDETVWSALEKSLDRLCVSKELILYRLTQMEADFSSIEEVEEAMTQILGEDAQIVLVPFRERLK